MLRSVALLSMLLGSMASCGGESLHRGDDASGGQTQTGGSSGMGGSSGAGGSSGTGGSSGDAGGSGDCLDGGPRISLRCYSTCSLAPTSFGDAGECRDGSWQCPVGKVPLASCPEESCVHREEDACCSRKLGARIHEPCNEAGERVACPAEYERIQSGGACIPESVDVADCRELDNLPCTDLEVGCVEGSGCGTTACTCWMNPDTGEQTWRCTVLVC